MRWDSFRLSKRRDVSLRMTMCCPEVLGSDKHPHQRRAAIPRIIAYSFGGSLKIGPHEVTAVSVMVCEPDISLRPYRGISAIQIVSANRETHPAKGYAIVSNVVAAAVCRSVATVMRVFGRTFSILLSYSVVRLYL